VNAIEEQSGSRIPGSRRWAQRKLHEDNGVEVDVELIHRVSNLSLAD
jgi:LDH2 family malate/lactate/ureidoglycolate dehydrogenase